MKKVIWQGSTQLAPVPAVMVGTGGNGFKNNLITVAWVGIVCSSPAHFMCLRCFITICAMTPVSTPVRTPETMSTGR